MGCEAALLFSREHLAVEETLLVCGLTLFIREPHWEAEETWIQDRV